MVVIAPVSTPGRTGRPGANIMGASVRRGRVRGGRVLRLSCASVIRQGPNPRQRQSGVLGQDGVRVERALCEGDSDEDGVVREGGVLRASKKGEV